MKLLLLLALLIAVASATSLVTGVPAHGSTTKRNVFVPYLYNVTKANASVIFELTATRGNPQIFISSEKPPTNTDFVWNNIAIGPEKFLLISHVDPLFPGQGMLYISIMCFIVDVCEYDLSVDYVYNGEAGPLMDSGDKDVVSSWFAGCCSNDVCRQGTNACDWLGVICDNTGRISTIQMRNRLTMGGCSIPSDLGTLSSLKRLDLHTNSLTGTVPSSISSLKSLEFLDLSFNSLEGASFPEVTPNLRIFQIKKNNFEFDASYLAFLGNNPNLTSIYVNDNKIFGQLPVDLGNLGKMRAFFAGSNALTGEIPLSFGNWSRLEVISVSRNSMTGAIPHTLSNWGEVSDAYFYSNHYSSIDFSLADWTELRLAYFHSCSLSGDIAGDWRQKHLFKLRLEKNKLSGSIPESICGLTSLQYLTLNDNQLGGELPSCFGNLTSLTTLNIGGNQLMGPLPSLRSPSLTLLSLGPNQFVGGLPSSFSELTSIQTLDISNNKQLNFTVSDVLVKLGVLKSLSTLLMSRNQIHGEIAVQNSPFIFYNIFKSLSDWNAASNRISGALQPEMQRLPALQALDLSDNQLSGAIPNTWLSLNFRLLRLSGNPSLKGVLPSFLWQDLATRVSVPSAVYGCPSIKSSNELASVVIDPSYYSYENCTCDAAFYGDRGVCRLCHEHMTCDGKQLPIIHHGYYPLPDPSHPSVLVQCQPNGFNETSCNPNQARPYVCGDGYSGRLCSECEPGFYREGIACKKCQVSNGSPVALPLAIVKVVLFIVVVIAFPFYVINLSFQPSDAIGGKLTSLIAFMQLLSGISSLPLPWPSELNAVSSVTELLNFAIGSGLECTSNESSRYWFFFYNYLGLSLPLIAVSYALLVNVVVLIYTKIVGRPFNRKPGLRTRILYLAIYLLEMSYFPVVNRVLLVLSCEPDPITGVPYASSVPWLSCDGSVMPEYASLYVVVVISLTLILIGIPLLFAFLLLRSWAYLASRDLWGLVYPEKYTAPEGMVLKGSLAWFGSFFAPYRKECFGWSMVVLARKLMLSFSLAFVPSTSALSGMLVGFTLLASLLIQMVGKPYRSARSNRLETTLTFILVWVFLSGQLLSNSYVIKAHSLVSISVVAALVIGVVMEIHSFLADYPFFSSLFDRMADPLGKLDFSTCIGTLCAPRHKEDKAVPMERI